MLKHHVLHAIRVLTPTGQTGHILTQGVTQHATVTGMMYCIARGYREGIFQGEVHQFIITTFDNPHNGI